MPSLIDPWNIVQKPALEDCRYIVGADLERYHLVIPPDSMRTINDLIATIKMRPRPIMVEQDHIWVPAVFHSMKRVYQVEVRLRG